MSNRTRYIVWIPFGDLMHYERSVEDPVFHNGPGTPSWWISRAKIFERYTMRSLNEQAKKDFFIVAGIAKETERICGPILDVLYRSKIPAKPFFHRAEETTARGQGPVMRAVKEYLNGYDELVVFFMDSDDMLGRNAMKIVQSQKIEPGLVMMFRVGYIAFLDDANKISAVHRYDPGGSPPPFFARAYAGQGIHDLAAYESAWKFHTFHHNLPASLNRLDLPDGNFCVTTHEYNTSVRQDRSTLQRRNDKIKRELRAEEMETFRKEFPT